MAVYRLGPLLFEDGKVTDLGPEEGEMIDLDSEDGE